MYRRATSVMLAFSLPHLAHGKTAHATTTTTLPPATTLIALIARAATPLDAPPPNSTYRPRLKEFSSDRLGIIAIILISTFCAISLLGILAWLVYYHRLLPMDQSTPPTGPTATAGAETGNADMTQNNTTSRAAENKRPKSETLPDRSSMVFEGNTLAGPRNSIVVCGGPMAALDVESRDAVGDAYGGREVEQERVDRRCWGCAVHKS
ncbi:hypothetical protein P153DRAFT_172774 [Dothidotthia symphoricarpi CBS 119687]|uniref:Uncharacterized protein n=1 Tax=Dothidotthia symphoricarpi CBS 119687 TaxID=1392245 RepID=A0A6A6ALC0_9PLEO|nr:uncharacterized protein P153DRAFT_172774 [Dothidotthia symphoricarpi CBS 119687]KAF2132749.1 hypothetical protein P153DRAFT_172774 [Dothidotthia symphoricarpi CBS 119687]